MHPAMFDIMNKSTSLEIDTIEDSKFIDDYYDRREQEDKKIIDAEYQDVPTTTMITSS